ncbi:MAG: curli-like amyloid fiber formation chaperone CsgH [Rhodobacter sp.]|nr:curli-like amyloid fiber formation chaperone CsgH [Rhodobacter sp.]
MALHQTHLGKSVLPAAAMALSAIGLAAGSNAHSAADRDLALSCEIAVSKGRYGHTYEGVVHADAAASGSYALTITKRGGGNSAMISQSGEFRVRAGQSETLGQATFGGLPPEDVDAELTLRWNGHRLICSNHIDI